MDRDTRRPDFELYVVLGTGLELWSNFLCYKDQNTTNLLLCSLPQKSCNSQIDFNLLTDKHLEAYISWQFAES